MSKLQSMGETHGINEHKCILPLPAFGKAESGKVAIFFQFMG